MRRYLVYVGLWGALGAAIVASGYCAPDADAAEEPRFTIADTFAAIEAVPDEYRGWVRRTVSCETGGTFDPYATNGDDAGYGPSRGVAQINDWLQRPHFHEVGFEDPYNPYESSAYLYRAFRGDYRAEAVGWWRWSCA